MPGSSKRLACALAAALAGCSGESWTAFVYPDPRNVLQQVELGQYPSLDECRAASRAALARADPEADGTYVCGLGCRERAGVSGPFMCERTER